MVTFTARTHPGFRAGENEDRIGWTADQRRFVVADGMGGRENGAVASQRVCDAVVGPGADQRLERAVRAAHGTIVAATGADPALGEMGSTVVAAEFHGRSCQIVWVGDSRAYLWRAGALTRLTRDHSMAELLQQVAGLAEEETRSRPDRHVLTQFLGGEEAPTPSVLTQTLAEHDWILLCSDGLTSELVDEEIADALRGSESTDEAADSLVSATLVAGARDNVSVVLVDSGAEPRRLAAVWHAVIRR